MESKDGNSRKVWSESSPVHPWRLLSSTVSLWLLGIFSLVATAFIFVVWFSYDTVNAQKEQILNWTLAQDLAEHLQPVLDAKPSYWEVQRELDTFIRYHRGIDLYILDASGVIVAASRGNETLEVPAVHLEPIRKFLQSAPNLPAWRAVYGDSPRDIRNAVPFSVAEIRLGSEPGYLYVNLLGGTQHILFDFSKERATVLICAAAFSSLIVITIFLGAWLRRLLTKRLLSLAEVAKELQAGRLEARAVIRGSDELTVLGDTMNQMAAAIQQQIETIETKDRKRRDLIADISHDLRSPAALISGYSELLLLKDFALDEKARKYGEVISRSAESLEKLLSELFELARIDDLESRVTLQAVDVGALLVATQAKYEERAREGEITLRSLVEPKLPHARADSFLLDRAIQNLVENALRYTPRAGFVTLSAEANKDSIRVIVRDTGVGMDDEALEQIFERHYQSANQAERQKGLSGLGLAIVRSLLEAQDSAIHVESVVQVGTVFWFELPKAPSGSVQ